MPMPMPVAVAVAVANPEMREAGRVMVVMTASKDHVGMAVMRLSIAVVPGVGSVAVVSVVVIVVLLMMTVANGVVSDVVNDAVDGVGRGVQSHEGDECEQTE